MNFLCVPYSEDCLFLMREAHASTYGGHFGTKNTTQHLQRHFHWPSMLPQVEKVIRTCALCSQSKPSNRKHGLYQPLPLPSRPWDSISMDSLSGLPITQKKHDAIWVVVCHFNKMALFIPCTKTTTSNANNETLFLSCLAPFLPPKQYNLRQRFLLPQYILEDHMGAIGVPLQFFYCIPSSNGWPNRGCQKILGACSPNSLWAQ
jgi:hypothetical protein